MTARSTDYGAVNIQTQVLARSKASTYIVSDEPESEPHQAMTRDEWERVSAEQDDFIGEHDMVQVDGYIGNDPERRVPARLYVERRNINIAAMQDVLYFHGDSDTEHEPELLVIYTPNLAMPGYPDDRLIAVNLDLNVTRVFNSDYFGESKKGGLRMWNKLVYDRGGLALHAGCKVIPTASGAKTGLIVGPLGHGQDDHHVHPPERLAAGAGRLRRVVAGRPRVGDRGRLFRQDVCAQPRDEPTIHGAVTKAGRLPRERVDGLSPGRSTSSTRATPRTAARCSRSTPSTPPTRPRSRRPTSCWC